MRSVKWGGGGEGNGGEGGEWGRGMMEREGSEGRKGSCGREGSCRRVREGGKMSCTKLPILYMFLPCLS